MKFKYIAYDKNSKLIKGEIEASSIDEAKELLKEYVLVDIKEIKTFGFSFTKNIDKKDLSKMLFVIGMYLKSSIPLIEALKLTKNQTEKNSIIKFLDKVIQDIKEGKNFYYALENQKILKIPSYIIYSIKIAEKSATLPDVLIQFSNFLKEEEKVYSKTKQALIYPFFVLIVATFLIGFILTTVVPKIVKIFNSINQDLPLITRIVINSSNFLQNHFLNIIYIFELIFF